MLITPDCRKDSNGYARSYGNNYYYFLVKYFLIWNKIVNNPKESNLGWLIEDGIKTILEKS